MDVETQYRVVVLIAEWYAEKSSEPEHDNLCPKIPVILNELKEKVAAGEEHTSEFAELCLLLQGLKAGVGGFANERDLEYMSKLNELEPTYTGYEIGRGLGDDNQIGYVISRATPDNQQELSPGTLRKIFNELSEKHVR